jgi:hypothetical protein
MRVYELILEYYTLEEIYTITITNYIRCMDTNNFLSFPI